MEAHACGSQGVPGDARGPRKCEGLDQHSGGYAGSEASHRLWQGQTRLVFLDGLCRVYACCSNVDSDRPHGKRECRPARCERDPRGRRQRTRSLNLRFHDVHDDQVEGLCARRSRASEARLGAERSEGDCNVAVRIGKTSKTPSKSAWRQSRRSAGSAPVGATRSFGTAMARKWHASW